MSFTLCLHASVPKAGNAPGLKHAADVPLQQSATHDRKALALTAGPADTTFYEEFYPSNEVRVDSQPTTGMLHRLTSLLKKAVKSVNFL
ncbi:MAG TPA: hypothetical protein VKU42_01095 [Candidatus Angelobacter sp.]|nr:hypothetical protein [Candidatus Angelobacter sp.]